MLLLDFSVTINTFKRIREHNKILFIHDSCSIPTFTTDMGWEYLDYKWIIRKHWYFFLLRCLRISRCCLSRLGYFQSRPSSRQNFKWDKICIFLSSVPVTCSRGPWHSRPQTSTSLWLVRYQAAHQEVSLNIMRSIIPKPLHPSQPRSVEKLSSTKPVHGAKKVGDHWPIPWCIGSLSSFRESFFEIQGNTKKFLCTLLQDKQAEERFWAQGTFWCLTPHMWPSSSPAWRVRMWQSLWKHPNAAWRGEDKIKLFILSNTICG